jgi:hypothetical protein
MRCGPCRSCCGCGSCPGPCSRYGWGCGHVLGCGPCHCGGCGCGSCCGCGHGCGPCHGPSHAHAPCEMKQMSNMTLNIITRLRSLSQSLARSLQQSGWQEAQPNGQSASLAQDNPALSCPCCGPCHGPFHAHAPCKLKHEQHDTD